MANVKHTVSDNTGPKPRRAAASWKPRLPISLSSMAAWAATATTKAGIATRSNRALPPSSDTA